MRVVLCVLGLLRGATDAETQHRDPTHTLPSGACTLPSDRRTHMTLSLHVTLHTARDPCTPHVTPAVVQTRCT